MEIRESEYNLNFKIHSGSMYEARKEEYFLFIYITSILNRAWQSFSAWLRQS